MFCNISRTEYPKRNQLPLLIMPDASRALTSLSSFSGFKRGMCEAAYPCVRSGAAEPHTEPAVPAARQDDLRARLPGTVTSGLLAAKPICWVVLGALDADADNAACLLPGLTLSRLCVLSVHRN